MHEVGSSILPSSNFFALFFFARTVALVLHRLFVLYLNNWDIYLVNKRQDSGAPRRKEEGN